MKTAMSSVLEYFFILLIHLTASEIVKPIFDCTDGSTVNLEQVCDGTSDCPDSSDESTAICRYYRCTRYQFRCSYGGCISEEKECDGFNDCLDHSDEENCGVALNSCGKNEFRCSNGKCITAREVCDGRVHCSDETDEKSETCKTILCPINTFRCDYGACVPLSAKCNGTLDCKDGSDESPPNCKGKFVNNTDNLQCPSIKFSCKNGDCIENHEVCDGYNHCSDASDEDPNLCITRQCAPGKQRCRSGHCVGGGACDGRADCADGTDEHAWLCGSGSASADVPVASRTPGACRLPPATTHALYTADTCLQCVPGTYVSQASTLTYTCDEGYGLIGPAEVKCLNTTWRPHLPICAAVPTVRAFQETCPPLTSSRHMDVICEAPREQKKGRLPCNGTLSPGTLATFRCREFCVPLKGSSVSAQAVCLNNGSWSQSPLQCIPECGKMGTEITPLIVNGHPSQYGMWSWLAALYVLQSGNWTFWCGGSLISDSVILTAAHCTWNQNIDDLRIALGKYHSKFDRTQAMTQLRAVKQVVMQPTYQDQIGNYGSDIALLFLSSPVNLTTAVRPVCIDWNLDFMDQHLSENNTGLVFGWGVNENDTHSDSLRKTSLMVRGTQHCIEEQSRDFKKFITFTSFCAGYQNGTGVCNGDSGGGLVFPLPHDNETWMLQGLVSVSPRRRGTSFCDPTKYTVFTKVGIYIKWLKSVLSSNGIVLWK